jgi:hypothetical protein
MRPFMPTFANALAYSWLALLSTACGADNAANPQPVTVPTVGGAAAGYAAGGTPPAMTAGTAGQAGATSPGGSGNGGMASAGASGTASTGGGGNSATAGSGGVSDPGDTPPARPLNVTAGPGEYTHAVNGNAAGINTEVPKLMGKLIVNLDGKGALYRFGLDRGFHVTAIELPICPIHYKTREHNGNCRLEVFDGVDRDPEINITPAKSVAGTVAANLKQLHLDYPEEDWGYYLNTDGTVRWSDVGFTGHSHRAQSATRFAVAVRAYRAVARSGPRDNSCGTGAAQGDYDPAKPPYDSNCADVEISAWLDEEPKTPIERFFGFVGKNDPEYGDIIFTMDRMGFVGAPVNVTTATAPYGGSHRFYADAGHDGFDGAPYHAAMNIAWGVPAENIAWANTH